MQAGAIWSYLVPVVVLLAGFGTLLFAWMEERGAQASLSWPRIPGVIETAAIGRIPGGEAADEYEVALLYRYSVNGQEYRSIRFAFGDAPRSQDAASLQPMLQQYRGGSTVDVFYNPREPSEAVLQPGGSAGLSRKTHIGAAMVAGGGALWLIWHGA